MKYFLDTANIQEIKKWINIIEGVTTNPFHLKKENLTASEFYKQTYSLLKNKKIFFQVSSIEDINKIKKDVPLFSKNNIIYKIPMHKKYFDLIYTLKNTCKKNLVASTTIYDITQINQAIEFGCDYTMVYYHKNNNKELLQQAYDLKNKTNSNIQLVGASFRSKEEVDQSIFNGMDYATVRPETLESIFYNDQLEEELQKIQDL